MGALAARAVVLVSFPFSDLSQSKLRPAVVLAFAGRDDWILSQITSKSYGDEQAITIDDDSFLERLSSRPVSLLEFPQILMISSHNLLSD